MPILTIPFQFIYPPNIKVKSYSLGHFHFDQPSAIDSFHHYLNSKMTRLLVFICFIGLASCCQRKGEIMTCAELPPPTRLEGAKILIVARVSEKIIDLRQKTKLLVQHTDLNCDRIQAKASTKVFLGDKMCSFVSINFKSI